MGKLSPWFRAGKDRPVNEGLYEVEYWDGFQEKREWRGGYWMFRPEGETRIHYPSAYIKQWRGVAQ